MRIHFASGSHPFPSPWINTDFEPLDGVNVVADLLHGIPNEFTNLEISYVGHFLEHLTPDEGIEFLQMVRKRTAPGGRLVIVGPDVFKAQTLYDQGSLPKELLEATKAHGYIPDDQPNNRAGIHMWDCTGSAVVEQCLAAGWEIVEETTFGKLHQLLPEVPIIDTGEWQFCVIASTPQKES